MSTSIYIIEPVESIEIENKKVKLKTKNSESFTGFRPGDGAIACGSDMIIEIKVNQTIQRDGQDYVLLGELRTYSHSPIECERIYKSYFTESNVPRKTRNKEELYAKLKIVPRKEDVRKQYTLTQGIEDSNLVKFNFAHVNEKWDQIMGGETPVIGHEKIKGEIISAIASGKHILLYGPPGTGKTMIASRLSRVFECDNNLFTANAEWTADDTIGGFTFGITQGNEQRIEPTNGYVTETILSCNINAAEKYYNDEHPYKGTWIVIDEMNRAKMDFAFGALFTALDKDYSVLNLPQYNKNDSGKKNLFIPNTFRLIGTMNNFDKNFLFKFSYALSRRFAHIYIGVPAEDDFKNEIEQVVNKLKNELITEYSVDDALLGNIKDDIGVNNISKIVSFIRGYDSNQHIRDLGTAIVIDTLRLYFIQKYVTKTTDDENEMMDIALSSILIPTLEGVLDDNSLLAENMKEYSRVCSILDEYNKLNY